MKQNELKPCPFCGGEAEITFSGRYIQRGHVRGYIVARCRTCKASVSGGFYEGEPLEEQPWPIDETIGGCDAAHIWNRRV